MQTRSLVAALGLLLVPIVLYMSVLAGIAPVPGVSPQMYLFGIVVVAALLAAALRARTAAIGAGAVAVGFALGNAFFIEVTIADATIAISTVLIVLGAIAYFGGSLAHVVDRARSVRTN